MIRSVSQSERTARGHTAKTTDRTQRRASKAKREENAAGKARSDESNSSNGMM